MIALLLGWALAGGPVRLDRVDLLSETSGTWLHDEAPRWRQTPTVVGIRYLEQVQAVIGLPRALQLGLGLGSQSLRLEGPLGESLVWNGGIQARALLPNGAVAGLGWRRGAVRLGLSLSAVSAATWARPVWRGWRVLPTVGLGLGPPPPADAPWMQTRALSPTRP